MRIIRTNPETGKSTLIAGYELIGLQMCRCFLLFYAQKEAAGRLDVKCLKINKDTPSTIHLVDFEGDEIAYFSLECPDPANYVVVSGSGRFETPCNYYHYNKEVTDLQESLSVDATTSFTDEYIVLYDGTELRRKDGITFNL